MVELRTSLPDVSSVNRTFEGRSISLKELGMQPVAEEELYSKSRSAESESSQGKVLAWSGRFVLFKESVWSSGES